ncbi:MAG: type II toxin-antitoxin system RelE/ParE family toxin [Pseudomonadota bacterium]
MRVILSGPARLDLSDIYDHIRYEAGPRTARAFTADLYERCSGLKRMPKRYALLAGFEAEGYRKRVYRDYIMVYRVADTQIEIIRVFHGASDYEKLLRAL